MPEQDETYLEWLAAAPKGVRWDKAQEMWEEYNRKRREQAAKVAKRLIGNRRVRCPDCIGGVSWFCRLCKGDGWINA